LDPILNKSLMKIGWTLHWTPLLTKSLMKIGKNWTFQWNPSFPNH